MATLRSRRVSAHISPPVQIPAVQDTKTIAKIKPAETFEGWAKLLLQEQQTVKTEADATEHCLENEKHSRVETGEHLTRIRVVMEPKRMFVKFLDHRFSMSRATAYRYMEEYRVAHQLPETIMERAMVLNIPIREKIIVQNPPPQTEDPIKIDEYLEKISQISVSPIQLTTNEDVLMKECINFVAIRDGRVGGTGRHKLAWRKNLFGMLMTKFGITETMTFAPVLIPEDFSVVRGRPKVGATATKTAVA